MTREDIKNEFIKELSNSSLNDKIEIRKLTPSEAFRLQGLKEDDINKLIESGISQTDLYKLAGNSIAIPCLQALFGNIVEKNNHNIKEYDNRNIVQIGHLIESKSGRKNQSPYRVYSTNGLCPTLMASMGCGGRSPLIVNKNGKYL